MVGYRLNSSGEPVETSGCVVTNCIACQEGDVLRVKGIDIRNTSSFGRLRIFDNEGNGIVLFYTGTDYDKTTKVYIKNKITEENGIQTYALALNGAGQNVKEYYNKDLAAVRLCGVLKGSVEDVVITINQEID